MKIPRQEMPLESMIKGNFERGVSLGLPPESVLVQKAERCLSCKNLSALEGYVSTIPQLSRPSEETLDRETIS